MQISPLKKQHPLGFWVLFDSLDLNTIFKKRDLNWFNKDRDFCVYVWRSSNKRIEYIGMGRYWDLMNSPKKWRYSRPFNHRKDLLKKTIRLDWVCEILSLGMTSKEAHILESFLINKCKRNLSKRGQKKWDGEALINKKRERKYERMFEEYLNLDGNNYWETFGWKSHDN